MSQEQKELTLQSLEQQSHQQYKAIRELNTSANTNGRNGLPSSMHCPPHKSNIHDMPNQDFINRLMTAMPAYFYSTAVGSNNFIFSDMLRSLVSARSTENLRQFQLQQTAALAKRSRKRPWPQQQHQQQEQQHHYRTQFKENECVNVNCEKSQTTLTNSFLSEKPLELTTATTTNKTFEQLAHNNNNNNNNNRNKYCEIESDEKSTSHKNLTEVREVTPNEVNKCSDVNISSNSVNCMENERQLIPASNTTSQTASATATATATGTTTSLAPPSSVWYPSIYPPYGIDPLHFFIDLRVSGHIFDRDREREREREEERDHHRKKENTTPILSNIEKNETPIDGDEIIQTPVHAKHRQGSAFTVPIPRSLDIQKCIPLAPLTHDAINLSLTATNATINNANTNLLCESSSFDLNESKENLLNVTKSNVNYMLQQHLPRLCNQFNGRDLLFSQIPARQICQMANVAQESDNKSDQDGEDDSDGRTSVDNYNEIDLIPHLSDNNGNNKNNNNNNNSSSSSSNKNNNNNNERDVDVEIIDCIKYRTDGESSRGSSTDDLSTII